MGTVKKSPAVSPDAATIAARLKNFTPAADPGRVELDRRRRWPASWLEATGDLRPAGVLVPLVERRCDTHLLLTRRAADLTHHAGQVSFPGGRMEPGDRDIVATAIRETEEEVGVPGGAIRILGALPPMPTITGYAVTPVVGFLPQDLSLTLDPVEVDVAFEVPLSFVLDDANLARTERRIEGVSVPLLEYVWGGERIWGATAAMIEMLKNIIFKNSKV